MPVYCQEVLKLLSILLPECCQMYFITKYSGGVLSNRLHLLYFLVSVLSDPTSTTSVYPVCCTAITRSWQYTGYSTSVMSELKNYSQCHNQFHVSVLSNRHLCNQFIVSVSSVCWQYVVSVLSETLFVRVSM